MLDIQFVRDNADLVAEKAGQKQARVDVPRLLEIDRERRELLTDVEVLRRQRNELAAGQKGGPPRQEQVDTGKQLKIALAEKESYLSRMEAEFTDLLKQVPNMPLDDVPVGQSEDDNVVTKEVGEKPAFDFVAKNHWELAEARGLIDKERAAKVAGSRFAYLKGNLVKLHLALLQFGLTALTSEEKLAEIARGAGLDVSTKPFTPVLPPLLIRTEPYDAMDRLEPREERYKIDGEELWLQGSAEHVLGSMHAGEIFDEDQLPVRYAGYATSFRREAGSYGKDMEGIFRLHQFDKLEMESFTAKENALNEHLFMVAIQEYLMSSLNLPYRVLLKCTADIGKPNARGVDIDAWLPGQGRYRETHTADFMTDYQARRLKTRVRRHDGAVELVHTNDATAFSQRPLIAILENYQTAEGRIIVPEVLRPYMGGLEEL